MFGNFIYLVEQEYIIHDPKDELKGKKQSIKK